MPSSIPPAFLEAAVWMTLNKYRDEELILLKGHLLIEVCLDTRLIDETIASEAELKTFSFFRKTTIFERQVATGSEELLRAACLTMELNSLRNRLAHEPIFADGREQFQRWASDVHQQLVITKVQRLTPRTRVTQAMAGLARAIFSGSCNGAPSAAPVHQTAI